MAISFDEYKKIREQAAQDISAQPQASQPVGKNSVDPTHEYKAWRDWKGNVNLSDITTGQTERYYQAYDHIGGANSNKGVGKDSFLSDLGQAIGGAAQRQGANYKSAGATLLLGAAGLLHGDNNYQPKVGSTLWRMTEGAEADTGVANKLIEDSKYGRGALGRFAMDLTSGAVDLAGDQMLNLVAPGAGMAAMVARSFGGEAEEQREQGKSISTQFFKGLKSAAIEYGTEKFAGIGGRKIEGGGYIDNLLSRAEESIVRKGGNAFLTKLGFAFGSEAVEEMMSDWLNPLADKFLAGVVKGDYDIEDFPSFAEVAYDGLVGGALGLLGGAREGLQAQSRVRSMGGNQGYADFLADQRAETKRNVENAKKTKRAQLKSIFDYATHHAEQAMDRAKNIKANEASQTPVEAQQPSTQQTTPEAVETPEMAPSREFKSKPEAPADAKFSGQTAEKTENEQKIERFEGFAKQYEDELKTVTDPAERAALEKLIEDNRNLANEIRNRPDPQKSQVTNPQTESAAIDAAAGLAEQEGQEAPKAEEFTEEAKRRLLETEAKIKSLEERLANAHPNYKPGIQTELDGYKRAAENARKRYGIDKDAKVEAQPVSASTVAAQPQEGQNDGRAVSNDQQAGREDVPATVRPGEAGDEGAAEALQGGRSNSERTVDSRAADEGKADAAETLKRHSERALKFNESVEKHSKGSSTKVRAAVLDEWVNDISPDDEVVQYISQFGDNTGTIYTDLLIGNAIESGRKNDLLDLLRRNGVKNAENIAEDLFGNEKAEKEEDNLPFTMSSDKPEPKRKTEVQAGKLTISEENGRRVATVKNANGEKAHIGSDVDTVRVAEKYKRQKGDVYKPRKNGYTVIQHGNKDSFTVVDKKGNVVGNYKTLEDANRATKSKGDVFNMALFSLADNVVRDEGGYITLDTDTAFTSADYLTTQGRSLASDELGILTGRHGRTGYTGNTTTDVVNVGLSFDEFLESAKRSNSTYAKYSNKQLRMMWQRQVSTLLRGEKDQFGQYIHAPGIYGKNGKHYVFAGWTASKSRKGVAIFMEEGKYAKFRKQMTGGLKPSEIKNFNPAKYLTNQGTWWTPSEGNTGLKLRNFIVMSDIFNTMHNVTRMFIRSSDLGSDVAALVKAGYTEEAAKAKLENVKAGESLMITGDLITNTTDGLGFVMSALQKDNFQFRGVGGIKGNALNFNFKDFYNLNVPISDRAFTVTDPETGEIIAGIRHLNKETGVELMNRWGKWQRINDADGILFESTVKFKGEYTVYKDVNGEQKVDADASTKKFQDAMGDTDLRNIPIENAFGRSWEDDEEDGGRIKGYTKRSLAQLTRSVNGLPESFAEELIEKGFTDPVRQALSTKEDFLRAIGVDDDTVEMPTGGSTIAYIAAADPDRFLDSNLGKKAAFDFIKDLAGKARGGQLYLKNSEHAYQYIAPDPFGLMNLMTQFTVQMQDAVLGSKPAMEESGNPLFDFALKGNRDVKNKRTGERYQGEIYSSKLAEGETMAARYPNNELTDSQLRQNVRDKAYEEAIAKYGFGNSAAFFALNDSLSLNMDYDVDGDTTFLFQAALAEALKKAQQNLGKSKNEKGRVIKNWELFTERGQSKAEAKDVTDFDVIVNSVKQSMDAPDIAKMDEFINVVNELPDSWLAEIGVDKRTFAAEFSVAYKISYDYAKDGKYDPAFAQAVADAQKSILDLLDRKGYYVSYEEVYADSAKGGKKNYPELKIYFMPALSRYEFSNKANKRAQLERAWAKRTELLKKGIDKKTVIDPGDALVSQFFKNEYLASIAPSESGKTREQQKEDFKAAAKFIEEKFPWSRRNEEFNFETISPLPFSSFSTSKEMMDVVYNIGRLYTDYVNKKKGSEEMRAALKTIYNVSGLDSYQFASLMCFAMSFSDTVGRYASVNTFLNFDQEDGTPSVADIIKDRVYKDGSLRRLERAINGINEELHEVIEPYQAAKAYYEQMVATRSEELDLKRKLQAQMSELDSEAAWLTDLLDRFKFSQKTFENRVKRNTFVAALMGEEEELRRFKDKVQQTSERLDALENEAVSKYFLTEDSKERIRELNKAVKQARDAMNGMVDNTYLAVKMLNEAKADYENRFEEMETKKWLAGYGRTGDTGLAEQRKQVELARKLDILLVLSGAEANDFELQPETVAFVEKNLLHLVGKTTRASINDVPAGVSYRLKPGMEKAAELWMNEYKGTRLMREELGIDLFGKVEPKPKSPDDIFDIKPEEPKAAPAAKPSEEPSSASGDEPEPPTTPPAGTQGEQPVTKEAPKKKAEPEKKPKKEKAADEEAEPQEFPKAKPEPVPREATYGIRFDRVNNALKRISDGFGEGAKMVLPDSAEKILGDKFGKARADLYNFGNKLVEAFNQEDDGASLVKFASELPEMVKNSDALKQLVGKSDVGTAVKAAKRLADAADAKNALVFQNAAADFAEVMAKEVEELPKTIETINTWMENNKLKGKLAKFLSSDNVVAKGLSMFFGYQRDFVNIAMALDNFDKAANGPGYKLADRILNSLYSANDLYGNAMYESSKARRAFDASPASKKTVKLEFVKNKEKETHTLSMAEAIDLLHNIVTLEESKISAWEHINYFFDDGSSMKISESGWFTDVKLQLQNAIKKDSDAKAFYDALSNLYEMYAEPSQTAIANASGRTVDMFSEGRYYPLWSVGSIKAAAEAKDFNIGIDDALYTKSRVKTDGGNIRITDPTKRFDSYMSMANKVVMNAEVGAAMERLDRGGLVPSLTEVVEDRLGKGHTDIVKATIKNANDFRSDNDEASSLMRSLRLNLQTGTLFGNFGAMLRQYPSVLNAVGILDFDDILYGARVLFDKELDAKTSKVGAIRSRFQSNYDPDVHDAFDGDTAFNKFWDNVSKKAPWLKAFSDGFQRVDSKAIKTIYLGAYHNVLKNGTAESDPDFEAKLMNLFKPAFLLTQPQYAKLIRPYVQVSENEFVRMFGMFKTQPLRNFNTMIRVANEYATAKSKYGEGSKELKDASKQLYGTISGQATASLMFGLLGVISKLLYHRRKDLEDKEGKLDAGKVMARTLMNAAEASGGMMVFGDAAVQFLIDRLSGGKTKEYWGLSAGAISTIIDVSDAITDFVEKPSLYGAKKAAGYISQLLGVPLSNAYSILNSGIMYVKDWTDGNEGNYDDILKYLDAQAKAAKKEEEKAAKAAAKEAEKSGADMLADTAKKNASQSDLNSQEEQKTTEVSTYLKKPYQALLDSGMSSEKSQDLLSFIDTDDNNSIKQAEMFAFYKDNPDYEQYVMAMWNSYGYKTSWEAYKAKHK